MCNENSPAAISCSYLNKFSHWVLIYVFHNLYTTSASSAPMFLFNRTKMLNENVRILRRAVGMSCFPYSSKNMKSDGYRKSYVQVLF